MIATGYKIKRKASLKHQQGAVLVVGLILLLILMIGAVSMMSSSVQDERMSGNARRSVDALMAAEAGMQRALTEMDEERWYDYKCSDFADGSAAFVSSDNHDSKSAYVLTYVTDSCQISSDPDELNPDLITALRLVSTGEVTGTNAERQIEFELRHTGGPSWPAIYLNDNGSCNYTSAGSEKFAVDGNGGAALGSNSPGCAASATASAELRDALENHVGGIHNLLFDSDFTTPEGLHDFYDKVVALDDSDNAAITGTASDPDKVYVGPHVTTGKNKAPETMGTPDIDGDGVPEDMRVTVIEGDMKFGGSDYGAGLLIVNGDVEFGGTPNWDGMMIILGDVTVKGGGGTNPAKEGFNGTMLVTNIEDTSADPWEKSSDPVVYDHQSGGGSASYTFDCDMLLEARDMLVSLSGSSADSLFPVDCTGGSGGPMGRAYIHEWYEVVNE